jgi:hypothetical protein
LAEDDAKKRDAQTSQIVIDLRKDVVKALQQYGQLQTEIPSALATVAGPYVELMQGLRDVQNRFVSWAEENREAIKAFQTSLANWAQFGAQVSIALTEASKQFQATLKRTDHIAKVGWTFPSHFYPKDLVYLAKVETRRDADAFVLGWYEEDDPNLEKMQARICGHSAVARFGTVLPQCFKSIRGCDYSIAIPSLIAVLEDVILQLNPPNITSRDVKKTLRKGGSVAREVEDNVFATAVWLSLHTFINELYKEIPSTPASVPSVLSRHGIQHGRFEAPNERVEAIRVLHTIETALWLKGRCGLLKARKTKAVHEHSEANEVKKR